MKKQYILLILVLVAGLAGLVFLFRLTEGFQDGAPATDPALMQMLSNLLEAYNTASEKVTIMAIQSTAIEGTTMDQYLQAQNAAIQALGESCSANPCTDEQIKDPSLLTAYKTANTVGALGLSDITFDTLAVGPPMSDKPATDMPPSDMPPSDMPDTQLPPAQMPASVMLQQGSKPSLDDCKKYYTCNISSSMA